MADYTPNAVVTYREDLNDELAIFRVRLNEGNLPDFTAGQYAELALVSATADPAQKVERRSYSIASPPSSREELELYIVKVQDGYLTPHLFGLKAGDPVWLGPKIKGKFTLDEVPEDKVLVMIATGTGLAPFLSMLREHSATPPWRKVAVIHGARFERDLGYRQELRDFEAKHSWFSYIPALTRDEENTSWTGHRGRVQSIFESGLLEQRLGEPLSMDTHFLLCGNPQMIDDVQALLEAKGYHLHKKKNPGNIHVERYW